MNFIYHFWDLNQFYSIFRWSVQPLLHWRKEDWGWVVASCASPPCKWVILFCECFCGFGFPSLSLFRFVRKQSSLLGLHPVLSIQTEKCRLCWIRQFLFFVFDLLVLLFLVILSLKHCLCVLTPALRWIMAFFRVRWLMSLFQSRVLCTGRCVLSVSLTRGLEAKSPADFFLFKLIWDLSSNTELYRRAHKHRQCILPDCLL